MTVRGTFITRELNDDFNNCLYGGYLDLNYENYYIGNGEQPFKILFVTGACRTGKTTLSRILGSMRHTEWLEEPYALWLLLQYAQVEKADAVMQRWRGQVFVAMCKELANDGILLRNGNFRPNDLSTVWNFKESQEIFHRLVNVNTRSQVEEYIEKNGSCFVIDVPEALKCTKFIKETYADLRVVHVVRNPYDVAEMIYQKHWYSDQHIRRPELNNLYRKYEDQKKQRWFIPWWVMEENEQDFVEAEEYERGIMYWVFHVDDDNGGTPDCLVRYEDMVRQPQKALEPFCEMGFCPTGRTKMLCDELRKYDMGGYTREIALNQYYREKFVKLKERYGYE